MFSQSENQFEMKQTRAMLYHISSSSHHIDKWSAILGIQFSTGPLPLTADWRGRKTTWGLLIPCPWFNRWSLWFVCPTGASGQDSKIVSGWWTGTGPQDTFVMRDWETTIRNCHYSLESLLNTVSHHTYYKLYTIALLLCFTTYCSNYYYF